MRVLLCLPAFKPALDYGGPVTKVSLLAEGLRTAGIDVEILTSDFGFGRTRVAPGRREIDGIVVHYCPRLASRRHLSIPARPLRRLVSFKEFDLVHAFGLRDGVVSIASFHAVNDGVPLVVEPMGMTPARVRSLRMKGLFDRAVGDRLTRAAAVSIATSFLEARHLENAGFTNVVVRHNPVSLAMSRNLTPTKQYDVCYIGRLHRLKRISDVLEAVARRPGLTAIIAGPDEDGTGADLRSEARRRGIADRVSFEGWVDETQRSAILEASRCFVLPSITENFGNAAAEALAAGLPAVVTRECGIASLVAEAGAGAVVDVGADGVANGINDVLRMDPAEAARRSQSAVQALSPDKVALHQLEIYKQALA